MEEMTMSQISPPLRILLIGCVVFLAAWMTVLKPGGGDTSAPAAPAAAAPASQAGGAAAQTGPGKAVEAANNTAAAQPGVDAAHSGEAPATTAAAPTTAAPGAPAVAAAAAPEADVSKAGLPLPVAKAVASNKIVVLLFWNPKAADDRAVRREMRAVGSRHRKDVYVHVANVKQISRYAPITRGANVDQSPSVLVVGRDRQVTLLEGYSDRQAIQQAIFDALRAKK
jgi:hypothetical protein